MDPIAFGHQTSLVLLHSSFGIIGYTYQRVSQVY